MSLASDLEKEIYLQNVRHFAAVAHAEAGQTYGNYTKQPFVVHLDDVVNVLREFNLYDLENPLLVDVIAASFLHDVFEDTARSEDEAREVASERAVDFAWRVTDGKGATRSERKAIAYKKIKGVEGAVLVKLADRIANTRTSNLFQIITYMSEYPRFREELYDPEMAFAKPLWLELDRFYRVFGNLGHTPCIALLLP